MLKIILISLWSMSIHAHPHEDYVDRSGRSFVVRYETKHKFLDDLKLSFRQCLKEFEQNLAKEIEKKGEGKDEAKDD